MTLCDCGLPLDAAEPVASMFDLWGIMKVRLVCPNCGSVYLIEICVRNFIKQEDENEQEQDG
jgi:hypothetical protein